MIRITNGQYHYTEESGIDAINLSIDKGEAICIMGPNGAGKSTLLKVLVGLYPLDSGRYEYDGQVIDQAFLKNTQQAGWLYQKIGLIFQNSDIQLFNSNVWDEIAFGPRQLGLAEEVVTKRVEDCLQILDIKHLEHRVPYHLSGGEKKLVAIASVLSMNPNVLIFDEPFNGLSPRYRELILKVMQDLKHIGKTLIISSHHFSQVKTIVDSIYVFSEEHTIEKKVNKESWEKLPNFIEYLDNL